MLRRSSLIIAASLAVLSTYEPGALCFAAAAPAAQPAEDRFERPRFMKKEIKRFVFTNSTMTQSSSTTSEEHSTTPISIPDIPLPSDVLSASLASVSLASAEASWSAAHPGSPFGGSLEGSTTVAAPPSTTVAPAASLTQPPPSSNQQSDSQGPAQGGSSSGPGAEQSSSGGNSPGSTPATPSQGEASQSQPHGGLPSVSVPSASTPSVSVPAGQNPSLPIPIEGDSSHTISVQEPTGQSSGSQPTGGQPNGGQSVGGQSIGGQQTSGQQSGGPAITGTPTGGIPVENDSSHTPGVQETGSQSNPLAGSNGASQPVQTAQPASGANGGVTPGSTPTNPPESSGNLVVLPPASNTNSLIAALSSALAISSQPPVNPPPVVNSLGQTIGHAASEVPPTFIGSSTNPAGIVLPITASPPAESSAGLPPIVIGSATDSAGRVIPVLTAGLPSASVALPPLVSTGANGVPITASAPASTPASSGSTPPPVAGAESAPAASGSAPPPVVGSESVPAASGSAPVIVGSSTNALGQFVPVTSTPPSESSGAAIVPGGSVTNSLGQTIPATTAPPSEPSGSTTNAFGQVVPISSAPPTSNDRFAHDAVLPSASVVAGNSQSAPQTGVGASEPANTAASTAPKAAALGGQTAGSVPPATSAGAPEAPANSALVAPLPIATSSQSYNTNQNAPLTQLPTASDSMTAQPVASSIEVASSSSPTAITGSLETGLPSGVPLVLYPPTGPVNRPANTELIQIGFLYPLNYDFVWQHEESQRQIFHYLPIGIAYGLSIDVSNVTMQTLRAWDTTQDLHYITTLALAWIPSQLVDSLGLILHTQAEKFYQNPDPAVRTLLSMINPALPIRADNATDGGPENGVGASPTGTGSANGGTIANGINNSSPVKASSVGIGVGVVCGAAAYGAAMFFVARRYKKRRQSHLRTPSMYSSPIMSQHGADPAAAAALMSGGMGERSISPYYDNDRGPSRGSGRSGSSAGRQQISAPVMAENSLGWN